MSNTENFWTRRKQAVEAEVAAEIAQESAIEEAEKLEALEEQSDEEILEELGLQDPETLVAGDDFSAFMSKAVPTRIRNKALRKLWLSDPKLANLDMLVDYGEDFTDSAMAVENIQSAYQVGKGMLKHVMEEARKAEEAEASDDAPEPVLDPQEEITQEPTPEFKADAVEEIEAEALDQETIEETTEADIMFAPKKRMRFVIEAQV
jgi:hypothetical protein